MDPWKQTILVSTAVAVAAALVILMLVGFQHNSPRAVLDSKTLSADLPDKPLTGVTVVLDPGHGGADPGTTSGPLSEAALTYRTAVELAAGLQAEGALVVYTVHSRCLDPRLVSTEPPVERPTDSVMAVTGKPLCLRHSPRPLWQRAGMARSIWNQRRRWDPKAAANVFFLSLHFDQFHSPDLHGGLVCVDRRTRQVPALAKALAGEMVQGNLGRNGDFHGIQDLAGRDLGVLDPDYNPVPESALLEIATLSNPQNAQEAGDLVWRGELVRRIVEAIAQTHQRPH